MDEINFDTVETDKFDSLASQWWDEQGVFKTLHQINPVRLNYIMSHQVLTGIRALDVGCGGGLLAEAMANLGAKVTGIDLAKSVLEVAKLHRLESGVDVEYREVSVEQLAAEKPGEYDLITCMEMLEHVPDPASVVQACRDLLKPGGRAFFATFNRNAKSWAYGIVAAEFLLNLLPRGTHDYAKFIRPSELASWCRASGLEVKDIVGMSYNPLSGIHKLVADTKVNYLLCATKPG